MDRKFIGIGIDQVCLKYGITNYVIREDCKVDVDGDVDLSDKDLTKLPLEFGVVKGRFICSSNNLTTLKGAPEKVGGGFYCSSNNLTTLEFAPVKVGGGFYCSSNNITTLKGAPEKVGGGFSCYSNNILDVEALVKCNIGGKFYITNNPISNIIDDIEDIEHFYLIRPLNGNKLSKELYDEVREDLGLPEFYYSTLHKDIELVD